MNAAKKILGLLYDNFGVSSEKESGSFYKMLNGDINKFPLNLKQLEVSDRYALSDSLMLSVMRYDSEYSELAFLNTANSFFAKEASGKQNASKYHSHDYFELVYVLDGQIDLLIEDTYHRLFKGDAYIINLNSRHTEQRLADHTVLYLGIKPDALPYFYVEDSSEHELGHFFNRNQLSNEKADYLTFSPLGTYRQSKKQQDFDMLFYRIEQELLEKESGYEEMCAIYIRRIFSALQNPTAYICSNTQFQTLNSKDLFSRTLQYLNEHPKKISRKELEQELSYNGNYISRVFLAKTGQSLASYNRDICLGEAARLLLSTDLSVRDICLSVGYENKTVFYDLFKKKYGMTPREYRLIQSSPAEMEKLMEKELIRYGRK